MRWPEGSQRDVVSRRWLGTEPAVTTVLGRALVSSRSYSVGRVWKLARLSRGFKPSRKLALWLQAVPTAVESQATAGVTALTTPCRQPGIGKQSCG
ncbi:hypothetical protein EFS30_11915 [Levilactobacillus parabrevis]|nr:hypothetical protein [Levilactobacillus parabrevis]MCT4491286.1 hypothetical protein [Levilactobacillus parabrevis]